MRSPSLSAALSLVLASTARAETVTLCQEDVQPGPGVNLARAIGNAGVITFACGQGARIQITRGYKVSRTTMIRGEGAVTLDAQDRELTMLTVDTPGVILELSSITLRGARPSSSPMTQLSRIRASVIKTQADGVKVELKGVTITANRSPINLDVNHQATLVVERSGFLSNTGAAIVASSPSTVRISDTAFTGNETAIAGSARLAISRSSFSDNTSSALALGSNPAVEIDHSVFRGNKAAAGGAISANARSGDLLFKNVEFVGNVAQGGGGAIAILAYAPHVPPAPGHAPPVTRLSIVNGIFRDNRAAGGGAVDIAGPDAFGGAPAVAISRSLFAGNSAQAQGGAIASASFVSVASSIMKGNKAGLGSAVHVQVRGGAALLANSLIVENETTGGGAAVESNKMELKYVTVARNRGAGVRSLGGAAGSLRLMGSILWNNGADNCAGPPGAVIVPARSVQFPADPDCPEVPVQDALLDSFYVPIPGSPVYGVGDPTICKDPPISSRDLFLQTRNSPEGCTLGPIETPPEQLMRYRAWARDDQLHRRGRR